jgi:hypothetical protein
LAVTPEGGARDSRAAPAPTGTTVAKPDVPDLAAVAWTDADIARFLERRARLLRWGWAEPEAEALAERLVKRDRGGDERRMCIECRHLAGRAAAGWRCGNARTAHVARDLPAVLVDLPQRCPGFTPTPGLT